MRLKVGDIVRSTLHESMGSGIILRLESHYYDRYILYRVKWNDGPMDETDETILYLVLDYYDDFLDKIRDRIQ